MAKKAGEKLGKATGVKSAAPPPGPPGPPTPPAKSDWVDARYAVPAEVGKAGMADAEVPVIPLTGQRSGDVLPLEDFAGSEGPWFRAVFKLSEDPLELAKQKVALRFALAGFLKAFPEANKFVGTAQSCDDDCPAEQDLIPSRRKR